MLKEVPKKTLEGKRSLYSSNDENNTIQQEEKIEKTVETKVCRKTTILSKKMPKKTLEGKGSLYSSNDKNSTIQEEEKIEKTVETTVYRKTKITRVQKRNIIKIFPKGSVAIAQRQQDVKQEKKTGGSVNRQKEVDNPESPSEKECLEEGAGTEGEAQSLVACLQTPRGTGSRTPSPPARTSAKTPPTVKSGRSGISYVVSLSPESSDDGDEGGSDA